MKGNDLLICTNVSGAMVVVAGAKSCEIHHDCDTIEISSTSSGQSRDFIAGRKSWSISCSGLLVNVTDVLNVGKTVTINVWQRSNGTMLTKLRGTAIITSYRETAARGSLATASITLKGSGELI